MRGEICKERRSDPHLLHGGFVSLFIHGLAVNIQVLYCDCSSSLYLYAVINSEVPKFSQKLLLLWLDKLISRVHTITRFSNRAVSSGLLTHWACLQRKWAYHVEFTWMSQRWKWLPCHDLRRRSIIFLPSWLGSACKEGLCPRTSSCPSVCVAPVSHCHMHAAACPCGSDMVQHWSNLSHSHMYAHRALSMKHFYMRLAIRLTDLIFNCIFNIGPQFLKAA